jgi:phytoene synthase
MHVQLDRYHTWQRQAAEGYHYIPRRYRTPLQTAAGMYTWTAKQITANPHIVYERKVKPSKWRVMSRAANHLIQG